MSSTNKPAVSQGQNLQRGKLLAYAREHQRVGRLRPDPPAMPECLPPPTRAFLAAKKAVPSAPKKQLDIIAKRLLKGLTYTQLHQGQEPADVRLLISTLFQRHKNIHYPIDQSGWFYFSKRDIQGQVGYDSRRQQMCIKALGETILTRIHGGRRFFKFAKDVDLPASHIKVFHTFFARMKWYTAVYLSALLSTHFALRDKLDDGWFYRSRDRIQQSTGLSFRQQKRAQRTLRDMGLLTVRQDRRKVFFKVDFEVLVDFLAKPKSLAESEVGQ